METRVLLGRVRWMTGLLIAGLVLSGVSAIPLEAQLELARRVVGTDGHPVAEWVTTLLEGIRAARDTAPFLFYGTDWLAFAHLVIAVAFVGAWRDPVRNVWLFRFGLVACALVVPWALVFGPLRGIPWWHVAVDCAFGVLGAVPLWLALRWTRCLEAAAPAVSPKRSARR